MADENVNETDETATPAEPVAEAADEAVAETPAAETEEAAAEEPLAEAEEPAAEPADEPVAEAEEPAAEEPLAEAEEPEAADEAVAEAPAAEPEAPAAEEAAPAPQSGPKPKKKRLPRSARPKRTRPKRAPSTERKPIVRLEKPDHERGRRQERQGTVVSDAMEKTIVVRVDVVKAHPRYKKVVRRSVKFHAHDETSQAKVGDVVRIVETRPLSKLKRWRLAEVVEAAK
jgi:small subunit ribosomal protein S17